MARNRFSAITRCLRFDSKIDRPARRAQSKLAPIRDFCNQIFAKIRWNFRPSENLCVDEQLVLFRGRCPFRVYIPSKPGKNGIKIWVLADVTSSYCCAFDVYTGKFGDLAAVGQGQRVVLQLTKNYYNSGRNITADNFFSSCSLVSQLLSKKLTYVGTVRKTKSSFHWNFKPIVVNQRVPLCLAFKRTFP